MIGWPVADGEGGMSSRVGARPPPQGGGGGAQRRRRGSIHCPAPTVRPSACHLPLAGDDGYGAAVTKHLARRLRTTMSDGEMRLWHRLRRYRTYGLAFRRQSPIGPYVADFECRKAKLIIEVDGSEHRDQQEHDAKRDACLYAQGYEVLRFWANDVLQNTDNVMDQVITVAKQRML
jgi:very-short-patch-repair endonuclease